jgi:hypothetical protein
MPGPSPMSEPGTDLPSALGPWTGLVRKETYTARVKMTHNCRHRRAPIAPQQLRPAADHLIICPVIVHEGLE